MHRYRIGRPTAATMLSVAALSVATVLTASPVAAQALADRVSAAPADATIGFTFEARPGVCGSGDNIVVRRADGGTSMMHGRGSDRAGGARRDRQDDCEEGPVRVRLERSGIRIADARVRVGGQADAATTDLGMVGAAEAVQYLHDAVAGADADAAGHMIFATTLANAEAWPGLLQLARDQSLKDRARSVAIFWLAQAAGERATRGLVSMVGDASDEIEVRKQAVFALSQVKGESSIDALIDIARTNPEPELRRSAMFWLGQSRHTRAIAFFEEVLGGRS